MPCAPTGASKTACTGAWTWRFGGGASLIRLHNAAQNFSCLHCLALNLLRADEFRSISLPRKLKAATYNPNHLATALQPREI
jgi:hypothetical protein